MIFPKGSPRSMLLSLPALAIAIGCIQVACERAPAPPKTRTDGVSPGKSSSPDAASPYRDNLAKVFADQSRDPIWAAPEEAALKRATTVASDPSAKLELLECRKTLCKIVVQHLSGESLLQWPNRFEHALHSDKFPLGRRSTATHAQFDTMRTIYYITAQGYQIDDDRRQPMPWPPDPEKP